MNAKLCKRLRREARLRTVGKPTVAYFIVKRRNKLGDIVDERIAVDPRSTRGVYHSLKRDAR